MFVSHVCDRNALLLQHIILHTQARRQSQLLRASDRNSVFDDDEDDDSDTHCRNLRKHEFGPNYSLRLNAILSCKFYWWASQCLASWSSSSSSSRFVSSSACDEMNILRCCAVLCVYSVHRHARDTQSNAQCALPSQRSSE